MKKIILALMVFAGIASADGFVVGTELTYGKVDSDLTASVGGSSIEVSGDTKSIGFALKGGYEFDAVRVLGTITSEKYKDDMVVTNEGSAVSYGVEVDYMIDNLFICGMLATGSKDFDGTDIDFNDVGARVGGVFNVGENTNIEAGIQYKKRSYDSYTLSGINLDLDDKIVGVFIGLSFSL